MTRPLPYIFDKRLPRWGLFISDLPDANWIEYVKHLEAELDRMDALYDEAEQRLTAMEAERDRLDEKLRKVSNSFASWQEEWKAERDRLQAQNDLLWKQMEEGPPTEIERLAARVKELTDYSESQDWHTEFYVPLRKRALKAEARVEELEAAMRQATFTGTDAERKTEAWDALTPPGKEQA